MKLTIAAVMAVSASAFAPTAFLPANTLRAAAPASPS
eukprot:CAMPEP_0183290904 /NCGR_PEP_ID=MMETSP0160_2-20130417/490_1 /TAXON_ID=2839 ORGANISM="Odontella Sinensis, Strain Grunow 1884" /NCGR_SAMPLE_ID=MMETSP0160_2 /ASSEMBLY_ACC=CAM_ASM_000250 /LENGTH=36 /DNA_ID= /DNA_START= /DNA_END= /DNA_ORIENTATION=